MTDSFSRFRDAIQAAGLEPPEYIEPGRLYRFPGNGKSRSNTAGWCKLFSDGLAGCFGDWSLGFSQNWFAQQTRLLSSTEQSALKCRAESARTRARAERTADHATAGRRSVEIWDRGSPAPADYPYLLRKLINRYTARLYKGSLMLPVNDFMGNLTSLQFIKHDGQKRLLSGGRKHGCFIPISGKISESSTVIICEGWATGCTIAENHPDAFIIAAIDAGNLQPVAVSARNHWPSARIIIAGDDDRLTPGNPGATKARAAAIAAGAQLALPQWPGNAPKELTDFNDLACWINEGVK